MAITAMRCMFTPMATEASPRARRPEATTRSWTELTPSPPISAGIGRDQVAGVAQRADALVRVGSVAVMGGGAAREVVGEPFGQGAVARRPPCGR